MNYQELRSKLNIQKYFLTGLISILPLWITFTILHLLFKWISNATKSFLEPIFGVLLGKEPATFFMTITSFIFTLFIVYIFGILATNLVSKSVLVKLENILIHIPFLKNIYSAARELIQFIFDEKKMYRRVVLIEWPNKGYYSFAFVTSEIHTDEEGKGLVSVFIPTTPNPTSGYLSILSAKKTIPLEMAVEEALKMIISGGVISSPKLKSVLLDKKFSSYAKSDNSNDDL